MIGAEKRFGEPKAVSLFCQQVLLTIGIICVHINAHNLHVNVAGYMLTCAADVRDIFAVGLARLLWNRILLQISTIFVFSIHSLQNIQSKPVRIQIFLENPHFRFTLIMQHGWCTFILHSFNHQTHILA